jgi:hypothetical protein
VQASDAVVILFQHWKRGEPLGTGEVMPDIQVEPDVLTIRKDGAGLIKSTSRETFLNFFERSDFLGRFFDSTSFKESRSASYKTQLENTVANPAPNVSMINSSH